MKTTTSFSSIRFFLTRFPCMQVGTLDELQLEFLDFQTLTVEANSKAERVEDQWASIASIKDSNGSPRSVFIVLIFALCTTLCACPMKFALYNVVDFYKQKTYSNTACFCRFRHLPRVMMSILLIPVSNCPCERTFSLVRKNRTDFRSTMGNQQLEALLILKTKMSGTCTPCHETVLSDDMLKRCKSATKSALTNSN